MATGAELGLDVDDAVVLSDSNRLVMRPTPCDLVARVAPVTHLGSAMREVEVARRLAEIAGDHRHAPLASTRRAPEWAALRCGVPRRTAGGPAVAGDRPRALVANPLC
jgi:hypothetical protein